MTNRLLLSFFWFTSLFLPAYSFNHVFDIYSTSSQHQITDTLKVSSDFESGSGRVLALNAETQTIRITPHGDPTRGWPNWWYIQVNNIDVNKPVILEVVPYPGQVFTDQPGQTRKMSANWSWPEQATFSSDKKIWKHSAVGTKKDDMMVYTIPTESKTLWIAWGPPFTSTDAMTWVEKIASKYSFAKNFSLCRSREGRSVPALRVAEGSKPLVQRPAIWVNARQHAWEAGGSWVGIGLIEWLISDDRLAEWLRQNAEVFFVPIMDVDHVATGDGGKNGLPQDHNLDWTDTPHWPEVAAVQQYILSIVKENRMSVYLDLHNPGAGNKQQTAYVIEKAYMKEEAELRKLDFVKLLIEEFGELKQIPAKPPTHNPEIFHAVSVPWVLEHSNPNTIAFCIETPWNTQQSTTEGYQKVGQKLGKVLERFLSK